MVIFDRRFMFRVAVSYLKLRKDPKQATQMLSSVFGEDHDSKLTFLKNYKEILRGTSNSNTASV